MVGAFLIAIAISLFAIFTQPGSWDYFGYIEYFKCSIAATCTDGGFENSFRYISRAANFVLDESGFYAVILFYIALSIAIKISVFKEHSRWVGVSIFVYCCHSLFLHEMTQIRAAISIAFCWLAYSVYCKGSLIKTFIYISIGLFFHTSALLAAVTIAASKLNVKILSLLCLIAIPFGIALKNGALPAVPNLPIDRLNTYVEAFGSEALIASQFNVYVLAQIMTLFVLLNKNYTPTKFELLAIKSTLVGLTFYFSMFAIPIIPLRVLEFMASLHPILAATAFAISKNKLARVFIILLFSGLWLNLAVRNNTRLDLIFDWQHIPLEYMTDIQLDQFYSFIK